MEFIETNSLDGLISKLQESQEEINRKIKSTFKDLKINSENIIKYFPKSLGGAISNYNNELDNLGKILEAIGEQQSAARRSRAPKATDELKRLLRMQGNIDVRYNELVRAEFFSYLSSAGIIPRYAFPEKQCE